MKLKKELQIYVNTIIIQSVIYTTLHRIMSSPQIIKNIYTTLAYYDGMDYPMTAFEAWKYLINVKCQMSQPKAGPPLAENVKSDLEEKRTLTDVITGLDDYELRKLIEEYQGFYFLRGRKDLVKKRISRNKIAVGKLKRLRKVAWFLRCVPFIRMIGVTGRLAMKHAEKSSDWDVLIVLKGGKIWTGRTLVTGFLHLIGKRRYADLIKDRICLNHFITDNSLEVATKEKFALFSAHEFSFVFPIFDTGIFQKFQLQNSWIKDFEVNYYLTEAQNLKTINDTGPTKFFRQIGEKLLGWRFLENWLSDWQSRKIMNNPKTNQPGSFIVASDRQLVFLPEPRGRDLLNHLQEKMKHF